MQQLIPAFAKQLHAGELPINGVKTIGQSWPYRAEHLWGPPLSRDRLSLQADFSNFSAVGQAERRPSLAQRVPSSFPSAGARNV